jgi:hypothetical protein
MATLEETKISFTKDEETNGLKCNVCNVCLNSIQQLQTHLNGNGYEMLLAICINDMYHCVCVCVCVYNVL